MSPASDGQMELCPKLGQIRTPRGKLIHTVLSYPTLRAGSSAGTCELLRQTLTGVAHDTTSNTRRTGPTGTSSSGALCPARILNLATATAIAKAVRQHGGGLVQATQPRAALRSRHQCPSGGAIKSLCCGAAGNIAFAPSDSATLEYPKTCVRWAQKMSTSLRSTTRPPAQLAVGYETSSPHRADGNRGTNKASDPQVILLNRRTAVRNSPLPFQQIAPCYLEVRGPEGGPLFDFKKDLSQVVDDDENAANNTWGQWLSQQGPEGLIRLNQSQGADSIPMEKSTPRLKLNINSLNRRSSLMSSRLNQFCGPQVILKACHPCTFSVSGMRPFSNQKRRDDGGNRAERLHPRRSGHGTPRQEIQTDSQECGRWRNQQQLGVELDRHLVGQHAHFLGIHNQASLQLHRARVQRGAA